jgi:membrane-associated HD superfamily phosphohydrolase
MQSRTNFTFASFVLRYLIALVLVFATYNPSEYSWVQWLNSDTATVYKVASGIVLLIGWIMFLRATWNSLGAFGTLLAAAFFAVIIWLLIEWGLLALDNTSIIVWVVEFILSGVLAVGMSWSHIRRRISGQYDTDEIEG